MVAMSYFCRQNMSQISLEIVVNCSHPSEILAYNPVSSTSCYLWNYKVKAATADGLGEDTIT